MPRRFSQFNLTELHLRDFRVFKGMQELALSRGSTVLVEDQALGKTSVANAILMCLYDTSTRWFERAGDVVNFGALEEGRQTAEVVVAFEADGERLIACREFLHEPDGVDSSSLHVRTWRGRKVESQEFSQRLPPLELWRPFFFGEDSRGATRHLEALASQWLHGSQLDSYSSLSREYYAQIVSAKPGALQAYKRGTMSHTEEAALMYAQSFALADSMDFVVPMVFDGPLVGVDAPVRKSLLGFLGKRACQGLFLWGRSQEPEGQPSDYVITSTEDGYSRIVPSTQPFTPTA